MTLLIQAEGIIELLQIRDNGGLCPFIWQELRIFQAGYMAGSCQTLKCFDILVCKVFWGI